MDVELAEERILIVQDRFSMDHAEGRAWTKRVEAFGTLAKLTGFLSRPKDEDFKVVYRERRLQPFWRIACTALHVYERRRDYRVPVEANVREVVLEGASRPVTNGAFALSGTEQCRDEIGREVLYDGVRGTPDPALAVYLKAAAEPGDADALARQAEAGTVVVPPEAKASALVRDVLASAIAKIEADRVIEEKVALTAVDLYYRPVYAFRYQWQGKEAVVEFDGVTGEARPGGETFEQYLGRTVDAKFLINVGVEAAGIFIPGVRLAEVVISKGLSVTRSARE